MRAVHRCIHTSVFKCGMKSPVSNERVQQDKQLSWPYLYMTWLQQYSTTIRGMESFIQLWLISTGFPQPAKITQLTTKHYLHFFEFTCSQSFQKLYHRFISFNLLQQRKVLHHGRTVETLQTTQKHIGHSYKPGRLTYTTQSCMHTSGHMTDTDSKYPASKCNRTMSIFQSTFSVVCQPKGVFAVMGNLNKT